jgi:hypothetical protein
MKYYWREGYCDALMGRECKSPYPPAQFRAHALYLTGYMNGKQKLNEKGLSV